MFLRIAVLGHFFALLFMAVGVGAQTLSYNGGGDTVVDCIGCNGMAITIPADNGGTPVTAIGVNAFANDNLASVTIPNTILTIGNAAFENNNLTTLTIPSSVTDIGVLAFSNNNLTYILFEGDRPTLGFGVVSANPSLVTVNYRPATTVWPGANIGPVLPTLLAFPPVSPAAAIPTLPSMFLMLLSLCMCLAAYKARKASVH